MGGFSNYFEGNLVLLTLYAEAEKPKNFCGITILVQIVFVVIALGVATIAYMAFGNDTQDIILLNLPTGVPLSIGAKVLYISCIMGSYVLMIQPIFHYFEQLSCIEAIRRACDDESSGD